VCPTVETPLGVMVAPKGAITADVIPYRVAVDGPLASTEAAARRCDNPIHPTTEAVGFLGGFYKTLTEDLRLYSRPLG